MGWRGLGIVVALAVVGAVAGAGYAVSQREEPTRLDDTVPASASEPSFPTNPEVEVLPDPSTAPLSTRLPTHRAAVGQDPFDLKLPVPDGWARSNSKAGEWRWFVESNPANTYVLRVVLPSGYSPVDTSIDTRIAALDGATGIQEFTVEDRYADGFTATYVLEGYKRLTMERYLTVDGSGSVYAVIAMTGREVDRAGMQALLDQIMAEATV